MKNSIAQIVVGLPVEGPFDYRVPKSMLKHIRPGQRVKVSFGRARRTGFVVGLISKSRFGRLKNIESILDKDPSLDASALELTKAISQYYGCSWGEAIETYLPAYLRNKGEVDTTFPKLSSRKTTKKSKVTLVHDEGTQARWGVINKRIIETIKKGKQVIFLVPEAAHIKAVVSKLDENIKDKLLIPNKRLTQKQDWQNWVKLKSGEYSGLLGTRSAVFAPLPKLGLIIIYDEENHLYKQEQIPHYHAHEVAHLRSQIDHCDILYVSSCPSAEVWHDAQKQNWQKVHVNGEPKKTVQIVDMSNYNPRRSSILSFPLQNRLQKNMEEGKRTILFMNRRGFSSLTRCQSCGHTLKCKRCDVNLTYLYSKKVFACRHCQSEMKVPKICSHCKGKYLKSVGTGIEKLESEVTRVFPHAKVAVYEKESQKFPESADIVIATQAILRFQNQRICDWIAVLQFDAELHRFDFRSAHQAFSLLVHLKQLATEAMLVQTRMRDNYCVKALQKMNFSYFYKNELKFRRQLGFPPYQHLVALGLRGKKEEQVAEESERLFESLSKTKSKTIEVMEPHPAAIPKMRDQYRYTIMCKGKSVDKILKPIKTALKNFKRKKNVILTINVDP